MVLHDYFRSSAAFRVRIALNLKGLDYERLPVNLVRGEQSDAGYRAKHPQGLVPALDTGDGAVLTQSLAIIEYLDEVHPQPPLLPSEPIRRARVRALALAIACDIHPLNNLRVLKYLTGTLAVGEDAKLAWYRRWVAEGFSGLEGMLAGSAEPGRFCHGDSPSLADVCLVPQVFNARRFECDLTPYPNIQRIAAACAELSAFRQAEPGRQRDAE